jgi:hypothetical protein
VKRVDLSRARLFYYGVSETRHVGRALADG